MASDAHMQSLSLRHRELETMIDTELKHPYHDEMHVNELKRLKLRIKDQLERLRSEDRTGT